VPARDIREGAIAVRWLLVKLLLLIGAIFLGYIAISLLAAGFQKHSEDGGTHLDLFIGGAVFGIIALAAVGKVIGPDPVDIIQR
jgi:hypothetical protein